MNLAKIIMLQKDLDDVINKNHPIENNEDRTANKVTALVVELAEFANEGRFFKYWSKDMEPRTEVRNYARNSGKYPPRYKYTNPLLEEYVDSLHFFASIAIDMKWEEVMYIPEEWLVEVEEYGFKGGLTGAFNEVIYNLMNSHCRKYPAGKKLGIYDANAFHFHLAWGLFVAIGLVGYGFTEEEIEAAYIIKNKENHSRQENNY